jgi:hypothetical protein
MDRDFEIFKGKKFSDLCKDVYRNSSNKRDQIEILISDLRTFVKQPTDALTIIPLIREYMEIGVKNDEHLIKLMSVVQKFATRADKAGGAGNGDELGIVLSDAEKKQLLQEVQDSIVDDISLSNSIKQVQSKLPLDFIPDPPSSDEDQ